MAGSARDTFLHFLADNLPITIPVHPVRRDASNPSGDLLQTNAVNVTYVSVDPSVQISIQRVVVDVLNDDENTCSDWLDTVFALLSSAYYTPLLDYTNPTSPVPTGQNVYWDSGTGKIAFKRIPSEEYVHYSCTLALKFHK